MSRERRVCKIANTGCRAPAAYLCGGSGLADGDGSTRATCVRCGDAVCTSPACSKVIRGERICADCESDAERLGPGPDR